MAIQIQMRRGTAAEWTSNNPTMANGEFGWEEDTSKLKIGDGTTAWTSLDYFGGGEGAPTDASYVTMTSDAELTAQRILTAGSGISITDGGANSTVTIAATGGGGSSWVIEDAHQEINIPLGTGATDGLLINNDTFIHTHLTDGGGGSRSYLVVELAADSSAASATTFLCGDNTWKVPSGGGGDSDWAVECSAGGPTAEGTIDLGTDATDGISFFDSQFIETYLTGDGSGDRPYVTHSLSATGLEPDAETKFLRGDNTWAVPSGGGGGSLTVEEVDGDPSVSSVDTIVVSNGTLTDDGGGQVTIAIDGQPATTAVNITSGTSTTIPNDGTDYLIGMTDYDPGDDYLLTIPRPGDVAVGRRFQFWLANDSANYFAVQTSDSSDYFQTSYDLYNDYGMFQYLVTYLTTPVIFTIYSDGLDTWYSDSAAFGGEWYGSSTPA